jgi:hypothetical protein
MQHLGTSILLAYVLFSSLTRPRFFRLEIKVEGCPKPELKWYKQGVEITPCEAFQIEEIVEGVWALTLHDLPENLAEIVAVAVNPLGMASDTLRITTEEGTYLILSFQNEFRFENMMFNKVIYYFSGSQFTLTLTN